MAAIKNVAIVGAGGRVGLAITEALLAGGKHTVTALTRPDSASTFPAGVAVKRAGDHAAYVAALRGQDALVITLAVDAAPDFQTQLIDAAAEAGVPWILPNEWGSDTAHPGQSENPIHVAKTGYRKHIEAKGLAWIAQVNGQWYDYSMAAGYYGIDLLQRRATIYDGGDIPTVTTTVAQSGRAAAAVLSLPAAELEKYRNKHLYVASFTLSQNDMWAAARRATGTAEGDWTVERRDAAAAMKEGQGKVAQGEWMAGMIAIIYVSNWIPALGGDYSAKLANEHLGLPVEDLDEQTKLALEKAKAGKW